MCRKVDVPRCVVSRCVEKRNCVEDLQFEMGDATKPDPSPIDPLARSLCVLSSRFESVDSWEIDADSFQSEAIVMVVGQANEGVVRLDGRFVAGGGRSETRSRELLKKLTC